MGANNTPMTFIRHKRANLPVFIRYAEVCYIKFLFQRFSCNFGRAEEYRSLFIPNRTFLVRFGGISGEFGRAVVRILARLRLAKIPMVRPNELDMLPKRTKKGAIRYLPYPNSS